MNLSRRRPEAEGSDFNLLRERDKLLLEVLNPKFESRNSKQIRMSNAQITKTHIGVNRIICCLNHLNFCHLILFRIS